MFYLEACKGVNEFSNTFRETLNIFQNRNELQAEVEIRFV